MRVHRRVKKTKVWFASEHGLWEIDAVVTIESAISGTWYYVEIFRDHKWGPLYGDGRDWHYAIQDLMRICREETIAGLQTINGGYAMTENQFELFNKLNVMRYL